MHKQNKFRKLCLFVLFKIDFAVKLMFSDFPKRRKWGG